MSTVIVNRVRQGFYLDSVALMRLSANITALPGVAEAALMIGSVSNKQIMREAGLLAADGESAGPNDLIIGIRADDETTAEQALKAADKGLEGSAVSHSNATTWRPKSLSTAAETLSDAHLVLLSVPGEFAAREAHKALRRDLNVMIFSDNVPLEQERTLKQEARQRGLLVMGPDCGTALLNGVPVAFANAVPTGTIGAIAASGTGLQEFSVLVARAGQGLSHGIGVGGRDLSDAIGGISTLTAIDALEKDPNTEHIVLISKPPGQATAEKVLQQLRGCRKPVTVCFIGHDVNTGASKINFAPTLRATAEQALRQTIATDFIAQQDLFIPGSGRRWLRGLFAGGTLCAEAQVLLHKAGIPLHSNAPIPGIAPLTNTLPGHRLLDLGADEYTLGRPHPMIEPGVRNEVLTQALAEPEVAVILLDVVLGYGAHSDPAGALADTIKTATPEPIIVASVCGVEGDPQDYRDQIAKLEAVGVIVAPSNAHAAELAIKIIEACQ